MNTSPLRTLKLGLALAVIGAALSASALGQTSFVTIRDDMTHVLSRTQFTAHADPQQKLHINVSLKSPNSEGLKEFVEDVSNPRSPHYRGFLTPEEIGARFGQPGTTVRKVKAYLQAKGFTIKLVGKSNLNIMADATVAQAEKAFNTTINQYRTVNPHDTGRTAFYANASPVQAPSTISSQILTISGLQNYSQPRPGLITINQAQVLYGTAKEFSAGMYGQGRTIAYSNFDGFRLSNLPLYYSAYSLPAPSGGVGSNVSVVEVDGGAGSGTANGEGDLDMQMILGMSPQCNLIIYDGSQNETDVLTQEQDDNKADIISESYGWGFPPADEDANHQIHLMMSAQGITYMCASGDDGTSFLNEDQAVYPDIDPDVLVVGGTIANTDATGNRISETAWPQSAGGYTNDGAQCNATPSYQKLGTPGIPTNYPYRLLPDVALNAGGDGQQGAAFPFYWNGQLVAYGSGTSFSSPLFAGGLGIAEQKLVALGKLPTDAGGHNRFGRINDLFYSQNLRSDVWFDLTSGSNGSLLDGTPSNAGAGWDTVTGLGAINFDGFVNSFGTTSSGDSVAGLTLNPTSVIGGQSSTATVILTSAAPSGGWLVSLASSTSSANVPTSISVPAGSSTSTFTVGTTPAQTGYAATITASDAHSSASATLTVTTDPVVSLSLSPTSVIGGKSSTGTVTLAVPAPSGGVVVPLGTSNSAASALASVTVAAGSKSANFTVSTTPVASATAVSISAGQGSSTQSATLVVNPATMTAFTIAPASVPGGMSATGTVTMNGAAPTGGTVVSLSSNSTGASVPSSVTIAAGSTSATFPVNTIAVPSDTTATISATQGNTTLTAQITIRASLLSGLGISPTTVIGGSPSTGTVTLSRAAPAGGTSISLSSNSPAASVPGSVTVPAGSMSASFTISTTTQSATAIATIDATLAGTTRTATITILPIALTGFSIAPSSVAGGDSAVGTVTINGPAPSSGSVVSLSYTSPLISIPSSVRVAAGATSATFTIGTSPVAADSIVSISASLGGATKVSTLTIQPVSLQRLSIAPNPVVGSSTTKVTGTAYFNAPPALSDIKIALSSSNPSIASVPPFVVFSNGAVSASFTVTHKRVVSAQTVTITATYGGVSQAAVLTVLPFQVSALSISPSRVVGKTNAMGIVTLNAAPSSTTGSILVKLSSTSRSITLPQTLSIRTGSSTGTFTIDTSAVATTTVAHVVATLGTSSADASLTILAPTLESLTVSPTSVKGNSTKQVIGTVTITGPAPASGMVITLNSSDISAASTPLRVTIPGGRLSAILTIGHKKVAAQTTVTIKGTLNGTSKSSTLTVTP